MASKTFQESIADELSKLPEEGPLPRENVRIWFEFVEYLANLYERLGLVRRGESFKNQGWAELLVAKVARDGVPLVAFITAQTTTDCMRVFLRQLDENMVQWREDKFA